MQPASFIQIWRMSAAMSRQRGGGKEPKEDFDYSLHAQSTLTLDFSSGDVMDRTEIGLMRARPLIATPHPMDVYIPRVETQLTPASFLRGKLRCPADILSSQSASITEANFRRLAAAISIDIPMTTTPMSLSVRSKYFLAVWLVL